VDDDDSVASVTSVFCHVAGIRLDQNYIPLRLIIAKYKYSYILNIDFIVCYTIFTMNMKTAFVSQFQLVSQISRGKIDGCDDDSRRVESIQAEAR
jgi:hypothetical protein